jgi:hypothetical protein
MGISESKIETNYRPKNTKSEINHRLENTKLHDKIYNNEFINNIFNRNDKETQNKILKCINKKPSDSDGAGYVYGFNRDNKYFIKIGRTGRDVDIRIREWKGNKLFSIQTIYNKKLERLVHLFFNYGRFSITFNTKTETEWFNEKVKLNDVILLTNTVNNIISTFYQQKIDQIKTGLLDLKTCSKENIYNIVRKYDLQMIGPKKIDAIFMSKNLFSVKGVGQKTISKLLPYIKL